MIFDIKDFREFGNATLEIVARHMDNVRHLSVLPNVQPGFLKTCVPETAPLKPEKWQDVLNDFERFIIPGTTQWCSPKFFGFYPIGSSYPAIVAEILTNSFNTVVFNWISTPAGTELEAITMDWLGKMIGLPEEFLNSSEGSGGGVLQASASEAMLVCLLAANDETTKRMRELHPDWDENCIKAKLVSYTSDQANACVEKAGKLGSVIMRALPTDDSCSLRGETLLNAIKEDLASGFIPFYVVATLGTTYTCAFDKISEIGPICKEYDIWLHVDAAYAGCAFICPEYRPLMSGIEYVQSFNINPHKWLLVMFGCSALWLRDARPLIDALAVESIYLNHDMEGRKHAIDYRHWEIPLGRPVRALKLWFVIRIYGVEGLQEYIRHMIRQAKLLEKYVRSDPRFELLESAMSLVCFRLKGDDSLTIECHKRLMARRNIFLTLAVFKKVHILRAAVGSRFSEESDITYAWKEITSIVTEMLSKEKSSLENMQGLNATMFDTFRGYFT